MLTVIFAACALVVLCVAFHLFVLQSMSWLIPRLHLRTRIGVGVVILGAIVGHLAEIGIFTVGLRLLDEAGRFGDLLGNTDHGWLDHYYFSAVTYTSLGFGDLTPAGPLRLVAAVEALTGLVLIAWTASFTFAAMQRFWGRD